MIAVKAETRERIGNATLKVERGFPPPPGRRSRTEASAHILVVKVTSATITAGCYPCEWQTLDVTAGTPTYATGGSDGWVFPLSGGLARLKFYIAEFRGRKTSDGKPVFVTAGEGLLSSTVTAGSDQSVNQNTPLRVSWAGSNTTFWLSSAPTKFTIPTGYPANGRVSVAGTGHFLSTDIAKEYGCRWLKNQVGTPAMPLTDLGGQCSTGPLKMHEERYMTVQAGDFLELFVFHNDGTTRTFRGLDAGCKWEGVA